MLLIDREIKNRHKELFIEGYNEECVESISYKVTVKCIIVNSSKDGETTTVQEYVLHPLDTVYIQSNERIKLPYNMTARIVERNSIMRKGLFVSGPHYQPGHNTYLFLRVKNLSSKDYTIKSGDDPEHAIAQIEFEQLSEKVETPYGQKGIQDRYQDEDRFTGEMNVGISETIEKLVETTNDLKEEGDKIRSKLKKTRSKLFAEILTLMGIFVAIFSLIVTDISSISALAEKNAGNILLINSSLGFTLTCLISLVMIVTDNHSRGQYKKLFVIAGIFLILLGISLYLVYNVNAPAFCV